MTSRSALTYKKASLLLITSVALLFYCRSLFAVEQVCEIKNSNTSLDLVWILNNYPKVPITSAYLLVDCKSFQVETGNVRKEREVDRSYVQSTSKEHLPAKTEESTNYFARGKYSKEKKRSIAKIVTSDQAFGNWWRQTPSKKSKFAWESKHYESTRRVKKKKKKKKQIVKTHDHRFAISHIDF